MESKLRFDDDDDDEKSKPYNKLDGFSSPRKRLVQAKIQANAIEDENKKVAHYKLTQSLSRSFVGGIIADTVDSLCEAKMTSK
mmetsp:Transcript_2520/g.2482  ORF Transcript_2520/g.2482 Transcript_2520/m.2482 type:complete len:83 (+) Transcript_2520:1-249(+)